MYNSRPDPIVPHSVLMRIVKRKRFWRILAWFLFLFLIIIPVSRAIFFSFVNPYRLSDHDFDYPKVERTPLPIKENLKFKGSAFLKVKLAEILLNQGQSYDIEDHRRDINTTDEPSLRPPRMGWMNPKPYKMLMEVIREHPDSYAALEAKLQLARITEFRTSYNLENLEDHIYAQDMLLEIITSYPLSDEAAYSKYLLWNSLFPRRNLRDPQKSYNVLRIISFCPLRYRNIVLFPTHEYFQGFERFEVADAIYINPRKISTIMQEKLNAASIEYDVSDPYIAFLFYKAVGYCNLGRGNIAEEYVRLIKKYDPDMTSATSIRRKFKYSSGLCPDNYFGEEWLSRIRKRTK